MSRGLGKLEELYSGVRFGQFASVGAVGATAETIIVAVLTAGYDLPPQLAKAAGAEMSITLMFLINDRWTFSEAGSEGRRAIGWRYLKSHLVRAGGLFVGFAVLTALTSWTEVTLVVFGADLWPTVANAVGIGCGMVLNYLTEGVFTWGVGRE